VHSIGDSANYLFAECHQQYTRQTRGTQQRHNLPRAHSAKKKFCRVPYLRHSANYLPRDAVNNLCRVPTADTRQTRLLPSAQCRHSAKLTFCRVYYFGTRQIILFLHLLPSKIFLICTYRMWYSMLKFGIILYLFAIFH